MRRHRGDFHRHEFVERPDRKPRLLPLKISVCIASQNEGVNLQATLACVIQSKRPPDEIIVVDDCSLTPETVSAGVKLWRSSNRMGSGPSKHRATETSTGDMVVVLDAHTRPAVDWLGVLIEEVERSPRAIMCPVSIGIESNTAFRGYGATLHMDNDGFWKPRWNCDHARSPHAVCVPAVVGGCYAMTRETLERIGGYAPCYDGYGCEEEFLSIRAWLVGHECKVIPRCVVGHYYDRTFVRGTADGQNERWWEQSFNRHVAAMTCFEDSVYDAVYRPRLLKACDDPALHALWREKYPAINELRELIRSRRVRRDAELGAWCGVTHPSAL